MQAPQPSRAIQRRSPAADPGPPPNVPLRSISPGPGPQPRASISSVKSSQSGASVRRQAQTISQNSSNGGSQDGPTPLSTIEKSVTHLLVATKQLLETLSQWSRGQATDAQVSDVYVRLGYEFNIACRAFTSIQVDTSDLGNVPELLRNILESTLSQEASVESLENYLPRIRDIIINLLHGLKRKQQKLRQKEARGKEASQNGDSLPRHASVSSVGSGSTGLTTLLDQGTMSRDASIAEREGTGEIPPRMSSASNRRPPPARDQSRGSTHSNQSSLSSNTMQNLPVVPPHSGDEISNSAEPSVDAFPPPPPIPPPKQPQNALAALQGGAELERRASRRYSAYQISKLVGASPNNVPMLPSQNSPIPNRGRHRADQRESMRAVTNTGRHMRQQSSKPLQEGSSIRVPSRVDEGPSSSASLPLPTEYSAVDSPVIKTPEDKLRQPFLNPEQPSQEPPNASSGPTVALSELEADSRNHAEASEASRRNSSTTQQSPSHTKEERTFTPEMSPPPGTELTLFLQYRTKVKKFVLPGGYNELSLARLQLAFIEKFAWNTHHNGVDLPELYIQDPVSGVRHELEDLNDIKDRSVLVLNVEVLDEVKRHIDEGLGGVIKLVEGVRTAVDDQQVTIQRVSDRQQDTANELARLVSAPPSSSKASYAASQLTNGPILSSSKIDGDIHLNEIQSLRRDLAVLRQTYSGFQSDIQNSMAKLRTKATSIKTVAAKVAIPDIKGESGRAYVNVGKRALSKDSDRLVSQVDDLQDLVEDLRKDVVLRGVRPLPRQLESVAKDLSQATMELKKMQEFLKRERPIWTKIWEKELETVCNDREEMTMQEELATDLQDDLEKATQTFALVEQATKEQLRDAPSGNVARALSKGLVHVVSSDPSVAKEGVLDEVRALQPNHQNRLEAIERAEKLRLKELESRRGGEFQKELGTFVEEGKLKKSGGVEEVERARRAKDERIRREVWERQNGMTQADAAGEEPAPDEEDEEAPTDQIAADD